MVPFYQIKIDFHACTHDDGFWFFFSFFACDIVGNSLASFCAEWKPLSGACKDRERLERRGWGAGRMTHLVASDGP